MDGPKLTIPGYPKIYHLGHAEVADIFDGPVLCTEKIDGSQFSFALIDGALRCRSKNCELDPNAPLEPANKSFKLALETASLLKPLLKPNVIYRAEYLSKPRHNALAYYRVPINNLILFGTQRRDTGEFFSYGELIEHASKLGLETVRLINLDGYDQKSLDKAIASDSQLGGCSMEGIVITGLNGKRAKYVAPSFKELHKPKRQALTSDRYADLINELAGCLGTPPRWDKALFRLRDEGKLDGSPKDIGLLMKYVSEDIEAECAQTMAEYLYVKCRKDILKKSTVGIAAWYQQKLIDSQFRNN